MSIELAFKKGNSANFEYDDLYGVKLYVATSEPDTVTQYFQERNATPLGLQTVFPRVENIGAKAEVVSAYVHEGSLFVCRTIADETTVYNYSAGASILLSEAWHIWQRHLNVCRLDLLSE
jgi:hypothetical protein